MGLRIADSSPAAAAGDGASDGGFRIAPIRNGAVASAALVQPRALASAFGASGPAHFDGHWRERPALAQLAWETCSRSVRNATPYPATSFDLPQASQGQGKAVQTQRATTLIDPGCLPAPRGLEGGVGVRSRDYQSPRLCQHSRLHWTIQPEHFADAVDCLPDLGIEFIGFTAG